MNGFLVHPGRSERDEICVESVIKGPEMSQRIKLYSKLGVISEHGQDKQSLSHC